MSDLDLEAIKARSPRPSPETHLIEISVTERAALCAEVERLRRALRSIAFTDHMTAAAVRFARNALDPETEASEPRCAVCGYDQHVAHHRSGAAKGYHPFVSHDRG